MVAMLAAALIVTMISIALVGLMTTDLTHAAIQHALARSFYIAQAGLEEAKVQVSAAVDPSVYMTPAAGVSMRYGDGQFTYWVDAGPATGCGPGFKTLEALGEVPFLNRIFPIRVRACGAPGVPFAAALFGVSQIQFQGAASRTYLAPYLIGRPGGGGNLGSFTEINFSGNDIRVNALSEEFADTVTLREGAFFDYMLFGFSSRPRYALASTTDPTPWILSAFGDFIKAQPTTGPLPNRCGTPYACVTVGDNVTDIQRVADLRQANYERRVYVNSVREEKLPPLALDPGRFRTRAALNTANAALNQIVGLQDKNDSVYTAKQFSRIVSSLSRDPTRVLHGTVYVDGTVQVARNMNLGGVSGNVTLAVAGDLIIFDMRRVTNRHDLSTVAGRRTPGIAVFGSSQSADRSILACGDRLATGSGRLIMCPGSSLVVDGLVYTQDGMVMEPEVSVDQVGAMYHNNRGTLNPSLTNQNATLVLRFDPLALSAFGRGMTILSWQQLR